PRLPLLSLLFFISFLLHLLPPTSPLFPYTTLFRSRGCCCCWLFFPLSLSCFSNSFCRPHSKHFCWLGKPPGFLKRRWRGDRLGSAFSTAWKIDLHTILARLLLEIRWL